ncbi:hypothetical protein ACHQM5_000049 [Ranunculus cassubicifolius]
MTVEQLARQRQLCHDQYVRYRQSASHREQRTTPTDTSRIPDPPPPLTSQDISYVLQQLLHHVDEDVSIIFGERTAPLLDIDSGNLSINDGEQIHFQHIDFTYPVYRIAYHLHIISSNNYINLLQILFS